ncbi:hypothetical protein [Desulfosporosinus nitroreducens]|uniref:hypothetical protein n=1 Tax=Desulfosporosinus nitroreducens TaxID=2018668 RepID=UPI00207D2BFC|nr:hypothetical protein [Desulfosporosinus nitroreducens]MCO1600027.1 hypothetical protein [Desulfosporosinus nitroreducens]
MVKNNREMSMLLGEVYKKDGKGRILQEQNWKRYFRARKNGNKYIIEEVYEKAKPKINLKKGNNNSNVYGEIVQKLIMNMLISNNGKLENSINYFLKELSLINDNYIYFQYTNQDFAERQNINEFYIREFYQKTKGNLRDIFERALQNLGKEKYLKWEKKITVKTVDEKVESLDIYRVATPKEVEVIQKAKEKVLREMNFDTIQKVIFSGKYIEYDNKLKEILWKDAKIYFYYYKYKIKMIELCCEIDLTSINELKSELNNLFASNTIKQAETRHLDTIRKFKLAIGSKKLMKYQEFRLDDEYTEKFKKLVSILIDKKAEIFKKTI